MNAPTRLLDDPHAPAAARADLARARMSDPGFDVARGASAFDALIQAPPAPTGVGHGGAAATSLLFWVGKYLIGLYLANSAVASPFGAAGTLVVVIVWVYYSAQIFFLGAEFTRAWAVRKATPSAAANSDYRSEPAEMIEVAKRIVSSTKPEAAT